MHAESEIDSNNSCVSKTRYKKVNAEMEDAKSNLKQRRLEPTPHEPRLVILVQLFSRL